MLNILSILIAALNSVFMMAVFLVSIIPLLGWMNWFPLVIAVIGMLLGGFSDKKSGLILNGVVAILPVLRLIVGGGAA
ncbi:MAG: hypothetical protein K1X75_01260 [Leptospirales bacterium]|nr:hypothetical protein [Leptospirales bacterium]